MYSEMYAASTVQKLLTKFKQEAPHHTDAELNYYITRFDQIKTSPRVIQAARELNIKVPQDIFQYSWQQLEQIVDQFPTKSKQTDKIVQQARDDNDLIYNQNNLEVYRSDSQDKCVYYGQQKFGRKYSFCISRPDKASNLYNSYRSRGRTFYFVYDKDKPATDKTHLLVIQATSDQDIFYITTAENRGDERITWDRIVRVQPKLKDIKNLFTFVPFTPEEQVLIDARNISEENVLNVRPQLQRAYINNGSSLSINTWSALPQELKLLYLNNNPNIETLFLSQSDGNGYRHAAAAPISDAKRAITQHAPAYMQRYINRANASVEEEDNRVWNRVDDKIFCKVYDYIQILRPDNLDTVKSLIIDYSTSIAYDKSIPTDEKFNITDKGPYLFKYTQDGYTLTKLTEDELNHILISHATPHDYEEMPAVNKRRYIEAGGKITVTQFAELPIDQKTIYISKFKLLSRMFADKTYTNQHAKYREVMSALAKYPSFKRQIAAQMRKFINENEVEAFRAGWHVFDNKLAILGKVFGDVLFDQNTLDVLHVLKHMRGTKTGSVYVDSKDPSFVITISPEGVISQVNVDENNANVAVGDGIDFIKKLKEIDISQRASLIQTRLKKYVMKVNGRLVINHHGVEMPVDEGIKHLSTVTRTNIDKAIKAGYKFTTMIIAPVELRKANSYFLIGTAPLYDRKAVFARREFNSPGAGYTRLYVEGEEDRGVIKL